MSSYRWIRHDKMQFSLGDMVYDVAMELLNNWPTAVTKWNDDESEHIVPQGTCHKWATGFREFANAYSDDELRKAWKQVRHPLNRTSPGKHEIDELRSRLREAAGFLDLVDENGMTERREP